MAARGAPTVLAPVCQMCGAAMAVRVNTNSPCTHWWEREKPVRAEIDYFFGMPAVITFTHNHRNVLDKLSDVFLIDSGTFKQQWSLQAEILLEPVGWDAMWKLSKKFCKEFEVGYPCIALTSVVAVHFDELTADVDVRSVPHRSVSLPERVMNVPLIQLWPTLEQREKAVNAQDTAEFLDLLRFFYKNLWMPWDDQDNVLLWKTVEDRMNLCIELNDGSIEEPVARSIITLRNSAIDAYEKLKELDSDLYNVGFLAMDDDDDALLPPNYLYQYAAINARLESFKSKWSLYEDPRIRKYHLISARQKYRELLRKRYVVALWHGGSISEFNDISQFLSSKVSNEKNLMMKVLAAEGLALRPEEVIFCSSNYEIPEIPLFKISLYSFKGAALEASEMRSCLLLLSNDCKIQDLSLSCARVNTIIVMREGQLLIKNCKLSDNTHNKSYFSQGVVAISPAKIIIENCTFENFYSGVVVLEGTQVELHNCVIKRCGVGILMYANSNVKLYGTSISDCHEQSIRCILDEDADSNSDGLEGLEVASDCKIGCGDLKKDVFVVKQVNLSDDEY